MSDIAVEVEKEMKAVREAFLETNRELKTIVDQQAEEIRRLGGTTAETSAKLSAKEAEYEKQLKDIEGKADSLAAKYEEFNTFIARTEADLKKRREGDGRQLKTVRSVLESDEAKAFRDWDPDRGGGIASPQLHFKSFEDYVREQKAVTGGDDLRSVLSVNLVQTIRGLPRLRTQHIRDHLTIERMPGIGKIDYIVETGYTNNAAFQTAEGATKPLSDLSYEPRTANPKTLAHGMPISRQLARHVPALVNRIENRLVDGLYHVEDIKILFSDGLNNSFTGITETADIQDFEDHPAVQAGLTGDDTKIDTIRRSLTLIENIFLVPDLVVLNNFDWEDIELTKDSQKRYIWVTVQQGGTPLLWRLPVFSTNAMTQGNFLTGAFKSGATLWETETAFVQLFTQHSDWALKNQLLLLAEMEETLTVELPEAFVYGDFASAVNDTPVGS